MSVPFDDIANVFTANQRINAGLGVNVAPGATGEIKTSAGIYERSRSSAIGIWIPVAYAAGNFTASGAGTWTVAAGDQVTYKYMLVGKTMTLQVTIATSTVAGAPNNLRVALPSGFTSLDNVSFPVLLYNDAAWTSGGVCECAAAGTDVKLYHNDYGSTNWVNGTDTVYVRFTIELEIT